jgi:L-threonylcarbamoyladenylate synthase
VHLADADRLGEWALDVPPEAQLLADAFWPGPLTMLLAKTSRVAPSVTGGRATVGLRVPDHPIALALLRAFGGGVAAPSANRFGHVSPTTAADVVADLGHAVDLVVDGGSCRVGVESTIIDLTGDEPEVLRPGGVALERITEVLGFTPRVWLGDESIGEARAPGMLATHYAPAAEVVVVSGERLADEVAKLAVRGRRVGVLTPEEFAVPEEGVVDLGPAGTPDEYARVLYACLRRADRLGLDVVVAVPPPPEGIGLAIRDRLQRAST